MHKHTEVGRHTHEQTQTRCLLHILWSVLCLSSPLLSLPTTRPVSFNIIQFDFLSNFPLLCRWHNNEVPREFFIPLRVCFCYLILTPASSSVRRKFQTYSIKIRRWDTQTLVRNLSVLHPYPFLSTHCAKCSWSSWRISSRRHLLQTIHFPGRLRGLMLLN